MPFPCSICGEESTRICVRCTKDACDNHLCEKCRRCSDCCECEVALAPHPPESVRAALHAEAAPEPAAELVAETLPPAEPEAPAEPTPVDETLPMVDSEMLAEPAVVAEAPVEATPEEPGSNMLLDSDVRAEPAPVAEAPAETAPEQPGSNTLS